MTTSDEDKALELVLERLSGRFPHEQPAGIARLVAQTHHQYDGRPVRAFVPVLVEREVADRLSAVPPQPRGPRLLPG